MYAYDQYLHVVANMPSKDPTGAIYQAGFQAGMNIVQQQLGKYFYFISIYIYRNTAKWCLKNCSVILGSKRRKC